ERNRHENFRLPVGKFKTRRQDSDHGNAAAVQCDRLSNKHRIASKPPLPKTMTDNNDVALSFPVVFRRKVAAKRRADGHCLEETGRDLRALQCLRLLVACQIESRVTKCREILESRVLALPVEESRGSDGEQRELREKCLPHDD